MRNLAPGRTPTSQRLLVAALLPAATVVVWLFEWPAAFWLGGLAAHALFSFALYAVARDGARAGRPANLTPARSSSRSIDRRRASAKPAAPTSAS